MLDPAQWVGALEQLADALGGCSAWLSDLELRTGDGAGVIARIDPEMPALYREHYASLNPFARADDLSSYRRRWPKLVTTDDEVMAKADLVDTEYYQGFMRPQDVHSVMTIRLEEADDRIVAIKVNRSERQGEFTQEERRLAEAVRGQLARAYRLGRCLEALARERGHLAEALDAVAQPMLIVTPDGALRHANAAADSLLSDPRSGLRLIGGRLGAEDFAASRRLARTIGEAALGGAPATVFLGPALALRISLLPAGRSDPLGRDRAVLVVVTEPRRADADAEARLAHAFGLTMAEARVAAMIAAGSSARAAAAALGVSYNTVRAQLASIFQKTGVHRQSELVALVLRTG